MKVKLSTVFTLLIIFSVAFLGIGYSSINNIILNIVGEASADGPSGIYITNITLDENSSNNYSPGGTIINDFSQTMMNSTVTLNSKSDNPQVVYDVTVYNSTDKPVYYVGTVYGKEFYDNMNVFHRVEGVNVGDELAPGASVTFKVIFYYNPDIDNSISNQTLNSCITFKFKERYPITYNNIIKEGLPQFGYDTMPIDIDVFGISPPIGKLRIRMGGKLLTLDKDFNFNNNIIKINKVLGPLDIANLNTGAILKVTYVNIDPKDNPTTVSYQQSFNVSIDPSIADNIEVRVGGKLLTVGNGYTNSNGYIKIVLPDDDVEIKYVAPEDNFSIQYVNIDSTNKPTMVVKDGKLVVDLSNDNIIYLDVKVNGSSLNSNQYKFENGILEVYKVTGPVEVINTDDPNNKVPIQYINLDTNGKPTYAVKGNDISIDLSKDIIGKLLIKMGDKTLVGKTDYKISNKILTIYKVNGPIVIENKIEKFNVTYNNIVKDGLPTFAIKNHKFTVDLTGVNIDKLEVKMGSKVLTSKQYTFANNILTINKPNGDIVISNIVVLKPDEYVVKYVNINSTNKPHKVKANSTFTVDLNGESIGKVSVTMNGVALTENKYSYNGTTLEVPNVTGPLVITNIVSIGDVKVTYVNMVSSNKPDKIPGGKPFKIDLTSDNIETLEVWNNNVLCEEGVDYTFVNGLLTVNNPINTLHIKKIIAGFPTKHELDLIYTNLADSSRPNDGIYAYQFSLVNLTEKASKGWRIYIKVPADFQLNYDGGNPAGFTYTIKDGIFTMENVNWNGEIPPGGSGNAKDLQLRFKTKDPSILPFIYATEILDYNPRDNDVKKSQW